MPQSDKTRRDFMKMASAAVVSGSIGSTAPGDVTATHGILNYNPSMNYRRLGKTEFMISEIALGGHGAHGYDERAIQNLKLAVQDSAATITRDPLPVVLADNIQMTQLLQNLIANALKYRGSDAPEIHVSAERRNGEWIFAVADNGFTLSMTGTQGNDFQTTPRRGAGQRCSHSPDTVTQA